MLETWEAAVGFLIGQPIKSRNPLFFITPPPRSRPLRRPQRLRRRSPSGPNAEQARLACRNAS
jgi:hypothetical protein